MSANSNVATTARKCVQNDFVNVAYFRGIVFSAQRIRSLLIELSILDLQWIVATDQINKNLPSADIEMAITRKIFRRMPLNGSAPAIFQQKYCQPNS